MKNFPRFAFFHSALELAVVAVISGVGDSQVVDSRFGLKVQSVVVFQLKATDGHIVMAMPVGSDPVVCVFSVPVEKSLGELALKQDILSLENVFCLCRCVNHSSGSFCKIK